MLFLPEKSTARPLDCLSRSQTLSKTPLTLPSGKISSLSVTPTEHAQSATVTFEKETAAKTALLLDNTQLGDAAVSVTAAKSIDDLAGSKATDEATYEHEQAEISQDDKPRSRVVAEYLAQGYVISDAAIEKAIALDKQHGLSNKFTSALKTFDTKFKATDKAIAVDNKLGVTTKAAAGWNGFHTYFDKAIGTPTGQKVRQFYETGNKQVLDVHNEARHLADLKKSQQTPATGEKPSVEEADVHAVAGDKTQCNCGATAEKCPCPPGKCACSNCAKNEAEKPAASAST